MSSQARRGTAGRILGELFVIVVGVLIAFWVEDFREELGDRADERELIEALQAEFAENRAGLDTQRAVYERRRASQVELVALGRAAQDLPVDSLTLLWSFALRGGSFDAVDGALRSAMGAGHLNLIQDATLRRLVARWPSLVEDFAYVESRYTAALDNRLETWLVSQSEMPPRLGMVGINAGQRADGDYRAVLGTDRLNWYLSDLARFHAVIEAVSDDLYAALDETEARLAEVLGG